MAGVQEKVLQSRQVAAEVGLGHAQLLRPRVRKLVEVRREDDSPVVRVREVPVVHPPRQPGRPVHDHDRLLTVHVGTSRLDAQGVEGSERLPGGVLVRRRRLAVPRGLHELLGEAQEILELPLIKEELETSARLRPDPHTGVNVPQRVVDVGLVRLVEQLDAVADFPPGGADLGHLFDGLHGELDVPARPPVGREKVEDRVRGAQVAASALVP
mmetsp:Transcript_21045/g.65954  ORF Transcript_21045/g.65954 Transcript_21045/m.65954 type:complete len:213 (-) Transcript_21045:842-1480(-)